MQFRINNVSNFGSTLVVSAESLENQEVVLGLEALIEEARRRGLKVRGLEPPKPPAPALVENEKALVETGRKIQAIKALRDRSGCSLRDAKDAVDAYAAKPDAVFIQIDPPKKDELIRVDEHGRIVRERTSPYTGPCFG